MGNGRLFDLYIPQRGQSVLWTPPDLCRFSARKREMTGGTADARLRENERDQDPVTHQPANGHRKLRVELMSKKRDPSTRPDFVAFDSVSRPVPRSSSSSPAGRHSHVLI